MPKKILVIGAGFSGAVIARQLADAGHSIDLVEARYHLGGNAFDTVDNETGIRYHAYGPHLFHTNNKEVFDYLSRFTEWAPYEHRVKAIAPDGEFLTFPPNKATVDYYRGDKNKILDVFFRPYSRKMWGRELEELDPDIINRVPMNPDDYDDRYFKKDHYQYLPLHGYTAIFEKMLDHPGINITAGYKFLNRNDPYLDGYDHIFNSAPIDEWNEYEFGYLPYRSIIFHHKAIDSPRVFPTPTVNFTHDGKFTRVTEWSQLPHHGHNLHQSLLTYEEPCDYRDNNMERYYPVKDIDGKNRAIYKEYTKIVNQNMTFIGRCGQYVYLDMHQAINSALQISKHFLAT